MTISFKQSYLQSLKHYFCSYEASRRKLLKKDYHVHKMIESKCLTGLVIMKYERFKIEI